MACWERAAACEFMDMLLGVLWPLRLNLCGAMKKEDFPSTCTSSLSRCSGPVGEAELEINIPIEEEELEICLPIEEEEFEIYLPIEEEELEICLPIEEEELEICLPIEEEELEICLPIKEEKLEICLPIEENEDEEHDTCPKNQQVNNILPAKRRLSCVKEIMKRIE